MRAAENPRMAVQVLCAWCNTTIREGDAHKESSHGICFACVQGMGLFPTEDIGGLSQEQLDALPIGVIELDRSGVVRRYNATEARAAGLDAQRVVGRHFFTEVAPCTSVQGFRGRCEQMLQSPHSQRDELDFVFRFRTGDRLAHLVFSWDPNAGRLTILVDLMGDEADHAARTAASWRS